MGSVALQTWRTKASSELDEIQAAHKAVGGSSRGRRYATLQLNYAYTMLVSSQFQRFCRDLHTEAASFLAQNGALAAFQSVALTARTQGRKLDTGNPNEGNIGSDFARLGMVNLWADVSARSGRNQGRRKKLRSLNAGEMRSRIRISRSSDKLRPSSSRPCGPGVQPATGSRSPWTSLYEITPTRWLERNPGDMLV